MSIDRIYAQTVNLGEPYHVSVQAYGNAVVYVSERTPEQFTVRLRDGDGSVAFSYRVVAKRLGHEEARLAPAPWADADPNLNPGVRTASGGPGGISQQVIPQDTDAGKRAARQTKGRTGESASVAGEQGGISDLALASAQVETPVGLGGGLHDHWNESWRGAGTGLTLVSSDGTGIRAEASAGTGLKWGVHGISKSDAGRGVYGRASASSGTTYGVYGKSESDKGRGVLGSATATTGQAYGVHGSSDSVSGIGVSGRASASTGMTFGVYGLSRSTDGRAIYGSATAATGSTYGVYGVSESTGGRGLHGYASATSGDTIGVWGSVRSPDGWAGRFTTDYGKGVYISVPVGKIGLTVASGTKNAVVATDDGARLLYVEESTEVWFADYGFGALEDGVAVIAIDPLYAQTVNLDEPYLVFVQAYGDTELYVTDLGPESFVVRSRGGDATSGFSYRVVARRLGYEGTRLDRAPWADEDPNL